MVPSHEEINKIQEQLTNANYQRWIQEDFLTWKWWLLIALSIIPWFIWTKIVDKQRIHEILLYGFFISIIGTVLDIIGTELVWWSYPIKWFYMIPPLLPADLTLVPVTMMIVYQYSPKWKTFFIANLIVGAFLAYIAEPIFAWLEFYKLHSWKLTYSFIVYVAGTLLVRWIVIITLSKAQKREHP